ncbi:lachesin-like isoform X5, partial [Vespula maculifrons]
MLRDCKRWPKGPKGWGVKSKRVGKARECSRESPPPSTSPSPSTTEIPRKVKKIISDHLYHWEAITELNNSVYANPNLLTIHNDKNMKTSNKFQSNINEIGKSEQKSSDLNRKRNYNWPSDDN